jgi:hypothetical protein
MSADPYIEQPDDAGRDLPGLLDLHAKQICGKIHTGLVCQVQSFRDNGTANVQPVTMGRFINGDRFTLPVLVNVPISYPGGGGFRITFPLAPGDFVFVSFSERSIDEWKSQGGRNIAPQSLRRFDLSDGVIVAFLEPPGQADPIDTENFVLGQKAVGGMNLTIYANGKVTIGTSTTELLDLVDQTLTALDVFTTGLAASLDAATVSSAAALKITLGLISTALSTIKGP